MEIFAINICVAAVALCSTVQNRVKTDRCSTVQHRVKTDQFSTVHHRVKTDLERLNESVEQNSYTHTSPEEKNFVNPLLKEKVRPT